MGLNQDLRVRESGRENRPHGLRPFQCDIAGANVALAIMMVPILIRERSVATTRTPLWPAIRAWSKRVFGGKSIGDILGLTVHDRAVRSALIGGALMLSVNLAIAMMSTVAPRDSAKPARKPGGR